MSSYNIFIAAGISLALQLFAAFFTVSLVLFIISSMHKKANRDSKLCRANNKLKVCLILSAVLFTVSVITFVVLLSVLPAGSLYWQG